MYIDVLIQDECDYVLYNCATSYENKMTRSGYSTEESRFSVHRTFKSFLNADKYDNILWHLISKLIISTFLLHR